jgi:uncharacterized RDD family membrane protein YckC
MTWYYMRGEERVGPITDAEVAALVRSGSITAETWVWREGMAQWQQYGEVAAPETVSPLSPPAAAGGGSVLCAECGNLFPADDMVRYGDSWICAACKPVFFQRLKEGAALPRRLLYAGFWIRFLAYFIDGVILGAANMAIALAFGLGFGGFNAAQAAPSPLAILSMTLPSLIGLALGVTYETWFIGKFGATPGKMTCGLKVVRPDESPVTYGRACGRCFAKILSAFILYIGFIMAGYDEEKRGLHDRICDTRVVRK